MSARVLVLGASGQNGSRIAQGLRAEGARVRTTVQPDEATVAGDRLVFRWEDPSTHDAVVDGMDGMFLLAPPFSSDPASLMVPLVERARRAGVRRFVLLSSSAIEESHPGLGEVHRFLRNEAPEWAVLRPSWFMQNFVDARHFHAKSIAAGEPLVTATGSAKVRFVDVDDIAKVAVRALLDTRSHDTDHVISGPEALSYDEIARTLSELTGIAVIHRAVSTADLTRHFESGGMPAAYAELLAALDERIREGAEAHPTDTVKRVTGHEPRAFRTFVEAHRAGFERLRSALRRS